MVLVYFSNCKSRPAGARYYVILQDSSCLSLDLYSNRWSLVGPTATPDLIGLLIGLLIGILIRLLIGLLIGLFIDWPESFFYVSQLLVYFSHPFSIKFCLVLVIFKNSFSQNCSLLEKHELDYTWRLVSNVDIGVVFKTCVMLRDCYLNCLKAFFHPQFQLTRCSVSRTRVEIQCFWNRFGNTVFMESALRYSVSGTRMESQFSYLIR